MCSNDLQGIHTAPRDVEHEQLTRFSYAMGSFGVPLSWVIWQPFPASSVATTKIDTLHGHVPSESCRRFRAHPVTY